MSENMTFFIVFSLVWISTSFALTIHSFQNRRMKNASVFGVVVGSQVLWGSVRLLEYFSATLDEKLFWETLLWIPIFVHSIATLILTLTIGGWSASRWKVAVLAIGPALFVLWLLTPHGQAHYYVNAVLDPNNLFGRPVFTRTPLRNLAELATLLPILISLARWVWLLRRLRGRQRQQMLWLVFGQSSIVVILSAALVALSLKISIPDTTPVAFTLSNLAIAWAIFRYGLFELGPMARHMLVETLPDAVIVTDTDLRMIDMNLLAHQFLNRSDVAWKGRALGDILHPEAAMNDLNRYRMTERSELLVEFEMPQPDKSMRIYETRMMTIVGPNAKAEAEGFIFVVRDMTEMRRNRETSFALALEKERAQLLADFLRAASHEFRTPLSVLSISLYLMGKHQDEARRKEQIVKAEGQISLLVRLLDLQTKLIALDRQVALEFDTLDTSVLLKSIYDKYWLRAQKEEIDLIINAPALLTLNANAEHLQMALEQVIENALKHTSAGGSVLIEAMTLKECVFFIVRDTGEGIDPEDLPRIFERFWRRDQARRTSGFGLGLPLVQRIVELHHGSVTAESTIGVGTTITLGLPKSPPTSSPLTVSSM